MFEMFNPFAKGADAIDAGVAVSMVKNNKAVLIDVRDPAEFAGGYAKGAINIPLPSVQRHADPASPECSADLNRQTPVILYCASGGRSGMAGKLLKKLGYAEVYNLGSLGKWQAAGGRTSR